MQEKNDANCALSKKGKLHSIKRTADRIDSDRRKFLVTSALGIAGLLYGCVSTTNETKVTPSKSIDNTVFDCNHILPLPKQGCYTGTNEQSIDLLRYFQDDYGLPAAFNALGVGVYGCANDDFPLWECELLHEFGTVPMLRYIITPHPGFDSIVKGAADDHFGRFANKAAKFGKPVVLVPWQCVNEPYWQKQVWLWSHADPSLYKAAWVRMHDIFNREGAKKNVVWPTKLVAWGFDRGTPARDPFDYIPDKEHIDILGWLCSAYFPGGAPSFNSMFRNTCIEASTKYPTKPQMFWELGAHNEGGDQAGWFDSALSSIAEQYLRVKGVMFDVHYSAVSGYNPTHSKATIDVIRKHFASGYFIGSALKPK